MRKTDIEQALALLQPELARHTAAIARLQITLARRPKAIAWSLELDNGVGTLAGNIEISASATGAVLSELIRDHASAASRLEAQILDLQKALAEVSE